MDERTVSHYRILEACGGGAMGRVYRARDEALEKDVALKFLAPEMAADPDARARFHREAVMAAALDHQHICTIHEVGQDDDETWFMAMDWYAGGTLKDRLADGPLPVDEARRVAREIALGLECAHRHGIVHRDIKPGNVAFNEVGEVKVLDFGVALVPDTTRLTRVGGMAGTVAYLAPEQLGNQEPTPQVDIWALGVVLHEMLSGSVPFGGDYPQAIMFAIANSPPEPLPRSVRAAAPQLAAVVARCLEKDPEKRFSSAAELAAALDGKAPRRPRPRLLRRLVPVAAVAAILLAAYVFLAPRDGAQGVAVLPFYFLEESPDDRALGAGLAWFVADRLSRLEQHSDRFWVVPPGDADLYRITDGTESESIFGLSRSVRGSGRIDGSHIKLDVVVFDTETGRRTSRVFDDDLANLRTWQHELPAWVAGVLDADLDAGALAILDRGHTSVPVAFASWLRGAGIVWQPMAEPSARDSLLGAGIRRLAAAVAADSSFAQARADLAWATYRRDWDDAPQSAAAAIDLLRRTERLDPGCLWAPLYLARYEMFQRNRAGALAKYDRVLALDPVHAAASINKAKILRLEERPEEAAALYARARAQRPGYVPHLQAEGQHFYHLGEFERALASFTAAVAATPRNYYGHYMRGAALFELGRNAEAEAAFQESITIKPTAAGYQNLATLCYYDERYLDAARFYQRSLALGASPEVVKNLAEAWRWAPGCGDSAVTTYRRAERMLAARVAADRATADDLAELATIWTFLQRQAAADSLLTVLAARSADLGNEGLFFMAVAHEDRGRRREALAWLSRGLAQGLGETRIEKYPGLRNLRTDPRYRDLMRENAAGD